MYAIRSYYVSLLKTVDGATKLDFDLLKTTVEEAVHFLDNVIDVSYNFV